MDPCGTDNFPDGWWTSKLGPDEDILHQTPQALVGDLYGQVHAIMRRTTPVFSGDRNCAQA